MRLQVYIILLIISSMGLVQCIDWERWVNINVTLTDKILVITSAASGRVPTLIDIWNRCSDPIPSSACFGLVMAEFSRWAGLLQRLA